MTKQKIRAAILAEKYTQDSDAGRLSKQILVDNIPMNDGLHIKYAIRNENTR